jgi:hypothetical protein
MTNNEPFSPLRNLVAAIGSGKLSRSDLVENRQEVLMEVLGCDSVDLLELVMEAERRSRRGAITVGNLVDNFPDLDDSDFQPVAG